MASNRRALTALSAAAAVTVAIVVAIAASGGGGSTSENEDSSDGGDLSFPAPNEITAATDLAYLDGDGQILLVMHQRAEVISGTALTAERCRAEAADLDASAPADEVLSVIGGLTDPVLRDAFHAERTALGVELTRCISGGTADGRAPDLAESVRSVNTRLDELGY